MGATKKNKKGKKTNTGTRRSSRLAKQTIVVGQIYADWCGHCKSLKSEWKKMKNMIKMGRGRNLKNAVFEFVEIGDTPKNQQKGITIEYLLENFNANRFPNGDQQLAIDSGFPTLFKICNKKLEYYSGNRTAKEMFSWYTSKCPISYSY